MMEQIADILGLSYEEKETMFNLAGKKRNTIALDLLEYIMNWNYVATALRTARDLNAGEDEWARFVGELKQQKG